MAIMPAWVRLRDTGRASLSLYITANFCNIQRYRGTVILFRSLGAISPGIRIVSAQLAARRAARTRARAPRRAQVAAGGRAAGRRASPHGRMRVGLRAAGTHASSCMDKAQGQAPFPLLPRWERD